MSDEIVLNVGSTRTWIKLLPTNPWAPVIRDVTRAKLSDYEFDPRRKRYVMNKRYLWYDDKRKRLYVPANVTPFLKDSLENIGAPFKVKYETPVKPRQTHVEMKQGFQLRPAQIPIVKYLCNKKPARKLINLNTGGGKTLSVIASAVQMKKPLLVIASGLCEQWADSIFNFTTAKAKDVCIIKGFQSLFNLLDSDEKPTFIIFSLETLRKYIFREGNYAELPSFERFTEYFGIGVSVFDEIHLNFHAITLIDLFKNIETNIYLSATYMSSNSSTRKVFNMIYPQDLLYGNTGAQRYIKGTAVMYRGTVPERATRRQRGYFHVGYENYLTKRKKLLNEYFQRVIQPVIHSYYINLHEPGEKCLIYFSTMEMINYVQEQLQILYPDFKVIKFVGGVKNEAMNNADIGVTNPKRAGTGTDIKNLRTVINTISFKAECLITQLRGRLRKLESGNTPEYVELVDTCIQAQVHHYHYRKMMHQAACVSFEEQRW